MNSIIEAQEDLEFDDPYPTFKEFVHTIEDRKKLNEPLDSSSIRYSCNAAKKWAFIIAESLDRRLQNEQKFIHSYGK